MHFSEKLEAAIKEKQSCLMLGLDPNRDKMPKLFHSRAIALQENGERVEAVWAKLYAEFCLAMLYGCEDFIMGIKIQMAYFEVLGSHGLLAVEHLIKVAQEKGLVVLIDGKRNDIGSTCEAYAQAYLEEGALGADSLTVSPFLGSDGIEPFVDRCEKKDRGIFILLRTSNPSSQEFQPQIQESLIQHIDQWGASTRGPNGFSSVGAVVGATNVDQLKTLRKALPHTWFLCPGVGAQGGSLEEVMSVSHEGLGVIIPVSRSVLYASDGEDFLAAGKAAMNTLWKAQRSYIAR